MNGLLFLSSEDFQISDTPNGKLLNCNVNQGLCLVLFYSNQCVHSQRALPIFKRLPQAIHGCSFGLLNVSNNARVVHISKQTLAPITYVPLIFLYMNGQPCYKYKGNMDIREIQNFILQMSKLLETKQQFVDNIKDTSRPEFTTGIPYCDDKVCYLEFLMAYKQ